MKKKYFCLLAAVCCAFTACQKPVVNQNSLNVMTIPAEDFPEPATEPPATEPESETKPNIPFDYTICFTGDISIEDGAWTTQNWINNGRDTYACFDKTIVQHMREADICLADNEFPYTTRGVPTEGKDYIYRANPENISLMEDLGVDILALANNHMYDYGAQGLLDTLETIDNTDMLRVGAGKNLEEASETRFVELDGLTVAFISGTRVEWEELTKGATETEPGVFRTVDPELMYQRVREAREQADLVIVYIHWGIEGVEYLEDYQETVGKELIRQGADAVIGNHTHCLQGIEFYDGKPIVYSLGNFWFNSKTQDSVLAELHVTGTRSDYQPQLQYVPALQSDCTISYISDPDAQYEYYRHLERISRNVSFDENGICREISSGEDDEEDNNNNN
ncbi:MAG: CapA family protein, partial [Oscillospiraceae bacterium]|nr:CapA family protein [Oscillospiraceae bacterium]